MVEVEIFYDDKFTATVAKIRDELTKTKLAKQIKKMKTNPKAGKPMRYERKGTRELYIKPYRLSYVYIPE